MKTFSVLSFVLLGALPLVGTAQESSNSQTLTIPLTEPGKKGQLELDIHNGSVTVIGYEGKDVLVEAIRSEDEDSDSDISPAGARGMRRISARGFGVTVEERANHVNVRTEDHHRRIDFVVKVPRQFGLKLQTHNNGEVRVENVAGEMDITSHNGGVQLTSVAGSAWVETHNGDIRADFKEVTPDAPFSFKTYNGDVELALPASYKATANFHPGRGEVYSDFEVKTRKNEPSVASRESGSGVYRVELKDELIADINGGGAALSMETYNGSLYVKKNK